MVKYTYYKIYLLTTSKCNSVVLSTFSTLYNYYQHPSSELCHHPKLELLLFFIHYLVWVLFMNISTWYLTHVNCRNNIRDQGAPFQLLNFIFEQFYLEGLLFHCLLFLCLRTLPKNKEKFCFKKIE